MRIQSFLFSPLDMRAKQGLCSTKLLGSKILPALMSNGLNKEGSERGIVIIEVPKADASIGRPAQKCLG